MIDPIAALIAWFSTAPALAPVVEGRIAAKHKYALPGDRDGVAADAWPYPARALRITAAGGAPDLDTSTQLNDLLLTGFGGSQVEAMSVLLAVIASMRGFVRSQVATAQGGALIYTLIVVSQPTFGWEPIGDQIGIDTAQMTIRTMISECPL